MSDKKSRREFVADAGKLAVGAAILPHLEFPTIIPSHVLSGRGHRVPSAGLNIAIVGCGGMGRGNAQQLMSENIVAFCDVDMVAVTRAITTGAQPNAQGRAPGESAALFRSEVMSDAEKAALTAIAPQLSGCVPKGTQFKTNRAGLRALLALAAYRVAVTSKEGATG